MEQQKMFVPPKIDNEYDSRSAFIDQLHDERVRMFCKLRGFEYYKDAKGENTAICLSDIEAVFTRYFAKLDIRILQDFHYQLTGSRKGTKAMVEQGNKTDNAKRQREYIKKYGGIDLELGLRHILLADCLWMENNLDSMSQVNITLMVSPMVVAGALETYFKKREKAILANIYAAYTYAKRYYINKHRQYLESKYSDPEAWMRRY